MSNLLFPRPLMTFLALLAGVSMLPAPIQARPKGGHGHKPPPAPKPAHTHTPGHTHKPSHVSKRTPVHKPIAKQTGVGKHAQTHGVKLKGGLYAYKGLNHQHWTKRYYSPTWRQWFWYDSGVKGWYYWTADQDRYLPIRYLDVIAPSGSELPPGASQVPLSRVSEIPTLPEQK